VELHGGHVRAHSEGAGRGSEFIVRLPLDIRRPQVAVAVQPSRDESETRLDIGMPQMSGYEVARALAARKGDMPLIAAVTGWGQGPDREQARDAGFGLHLVKPVSEAALKSALSAASLRTQAQSGG
jgi:CheY-like chemotaxis protein